MIKGSSLAALISLLLMIVSPSEAAPIRPAQVCGAARFRASGVEFHDRLLCKKHWLGTGRTAACKVAATKRRADAFETGEQSDWCLPGADSATMGGRVDALVRSTFRMLDANNPERSRCTKRELGVAARFFWKLVQVHVRDVYHPDPARLADDIALLEQRFEAALERAQARGGCAAEGAQADLLFEWLADVAMELRDLLPTMHQAECPCWTADDLDDEFDAGYFDRLERGGIECGGEVALGFSSVDSCTLPGPNGPNDEPISLARAGAGLIPGTAVFSPDLDFNDNDGACDEIPEICPMTREETDACVAELFASRVYRDNCM